MNAQSCGLVMYKLYCTNRAKKLVIEWATQHQDELVANWERAKALQTLDNIDPLD